MLVTVNKVSDDGMIRNYELDVVDAWWDPLYNQGGVKIVGAARLIMQDNKEFHLTGLHDPKLVVKIIKTSIEAFCLTADFFDNSAMADDKAFNLLNTSLVEHYDFFSQAKKVRFFREFLQEFGHEEWRTLTKTKKTSTTDALQHLRGTMPTPHKPRGVSKLQYFKFLFQ